jgi:hypothetical protein
MDRAAQALGDMRALPPRRALLMASLMAMAATGEVAGQPLGTFRWQLQPYCNVISVTVTQVGGVYRLEGRDDRCGAAVTSSVIGTAFLNPDGSVGLGLNLVAAPGGQPHPVSARIALSTLSGTWNDAQASGVFAFTPGAGTGGSPRPLPVTVGLTPPTIRLQADGGFLAAGTFGVGTLPASGAGVRLMWAPAKAAIRAGRVEGTQWDDVNIGSESAAFGHNTRASGVASFAANDTTEASGEASTALGFNTRATGVASMAIGEQTVASGRAAFAGGQGSTAAGIGSFAMGATQAHATYSAAFGNASAASGQGAVALGFRSVASGSNSFASGDSNQAAGSRSVAIGAAAQTGGESSAALGLRVRASGLGSIVLGSDAVANPAATGSFVFGDRSTTTDIVSFTPNQFIVRAAGGVGFYTNAATTTGVEMAAGGSSWASLSDARMKENVRDVSGAEILEKLARLPILEWNYTSQAPDIRHMGPTAQAFRAAFGLGESDRHIDTIDADGVALTAAKALADRAAVVESGSAAMARANDRRRRTNDDLARDNAALRKRIERIERALERREAR